MCGTLYNASRMDIEGTAPVRRVYRRHRDDKQRDRQKHPSLVKRDGARALAMRRRVRRLWKTEHGLAAYAEPGSQCVTSTTRTGAINTGEDRPPPENARDTDEWVCVVALPRDDGVRHATLSVLVWLRRRLRAAFAYQTLPSTSPSTPSPPALPTSWRRGRRRKTPRSSTGSRAWGTPGS